MNSFTDWDTELYHHGIKGQKWGVRRFQNEDGALTEAGKKRYGASAQQKQIYNTIKGDKKYAEHLKNDPSVKAAVKDLSSYAKHYRQVDKKHQKETAPLYKDRTLFDHYSKKALNAEDTDLDWFWNHPIKIAQTESYLKDKNPALLKEHRDAWRSYENQSKYLAQQLLGKYGSEKMHSFGSDSKADYLATLLRKMAK